MDNTREKLIELLKNNREHYLDTYITEHHKSYEEYTADYLIANGVTIQRWIPVTERLPEKEKDVLCSRGNHIGALMDVYTYMGNDKWDDTYGNRSYTKDEGITHWMPLPEPPKGE